MDQKDPRTIKEGINKIENQGQNWYKTLENGQMTNFRSNYLWK